MGAPNGITGLHERYKADGAVFTTWLVNSAREAGYEAVGCSSEEETPGSGDEKKHDLGGGYSVPCREFKACALAIVGKSPPKSCMPVAVLERLQRSIQLRARRARVARFYENIARKQTVPSPDLEKSIRDHRYFLQVLRETRKILEPCWVEVKSSPEAPIDGKEPVINAYACLFVEGLEERLFQPAIGPVHVADFGPTEDIYEADAGDEDLALAIFCLLQDLDGIRREVRALWRGVKAHENDIISVSAATTAAMQLGERLILSFLDSYPQPEDPTGTVLDRLAGIAGPEGARLKFGYQMTHCSISNVARVLSHLRSMGIPELHSVAVESRAEEAARQELRSTIDFMGPDDAECTSHFVTLLPLVADITFLEWQDLRPSKRIGDHLARLWSEYLKDNAAEVPKLSLVFGFCLYLEIAHMMGDDIKLGLNAAVAERTLVQEIKRYSERVSSECGILSALCEMFLTDTAEAAKKQTLQSSGVGTQDQ